MRLYLSSYQLGDHPEHLVRLAGEGARGLVIMNALDAASDQERRRRDTGIQIANLEALGLRAQNLDLREHTAATIDGALAGVEFLWVRGGNVFVLREALARSGADAAIVAALRRNRFVYAGFSAGPCVLAPSLRGLEHCDPVSDADRRYGTHRYDGLGILDRPVVPHLNSDGHPETELLGEVARRYVAAGQPFYALSDGQALVIEGNSTTFV